MDQVLKELRIELHKINVNFTNSWDFILKRDNPFQFLYNKHKINDYDRERIEAAISRANEKVLNPTHHQPQLSLPGSAPAAPGQPGGNQPDEPPKKPWWPFNGGKKRTRKSRKSKKTRRRK